MKATVTVPYPLDAKGVSGPQWANRKDLVVGKTYLLSRETPLMADLNPVGFDATMVIASAKAIPATGSITIKQIAAKSGARWYQVQARDGKAAVIGVGCVNADALIGQQVAVKEKPQ